ncbi:MAG: BatD family protein [Halioglobus sp.]|nr:BatD family protein [Halioglobus sp.]
MIHTRYSAIPGALLLLLLTLATPCGFGAEPTPRDLLADGRLQVKAWLTPADTIVPGQKLTLNLEIATERWFSGGTRISLPEVAGLVILQTEQFASNASERRQEQNWVLQRWTLDVYPQRAGTFTIPPVSARIKVNTADAGDIEGSIESPAVEFTATLPPALADIPQWVASPHFSVSQSFDRSLENLAVGDAFEREIVFEASDVMAMMLPGFSAAEWPGLATYPAPPELDNNSNRGQTLASRRQRISYVVQAEGQYQLEAADFYWWDTSRGELKVLSLPATVITVGAGGQGANTGGDGLPVTRRQMLLVAGGLVLLAAVLWLIWLYLPRISSGRLGRGLAALRRQLDAMRKPALPERLNPGSSAGE